MEKPSEAIIVSTAFIGLQIAGLILVPNDFLNDSTPHMLTLGLILMLMVPITRGFGSLVWRIVPIATFYALAIVFRTVDLAVCPMLPIGTHFLWHIAGAATGYFVVRFVSMLEVAVQAERVAT
jgi:hypothetical protein